MFGGRSAKFVTLFQVLPPSIVLYICPLVLPVHTTPCLTVEIEKSEIEARAADCGPAGAGAPGEGDGVGAGATPHGASDCPFGAVRSGLNAFHVWAPSRVTRMQL